MALQYEYKWPVLCLIGKQERMVFTGYGKRGTRKGNGVMKRSGMLLALVGALMFAGGLSADDKDGKRPEKGKDDKENHRRKEEMLKRFDKNHDGQLDDNERAAMKAEMEKHREGDRPSKEELLKKFDKNGDGELDENERAAAKAAMGERRGDGPNYEEMLKKFDLNGDGKLDDNEREAAKKEWEKNHKDRKDDRKEKK